MLDNSLVISLYCFGLAYPAFLILKVPNGHALNEGYDCPVIYLPPSKIHIANYNTVNVVQKALVQQKYLSETYSSLEVSHHTSVKYYNLYARTPVHTH